MPDGPGALPSACPRCGTELVPRLLTCPGCGRLAHAETLARLAAEAEAAAQRGDPASAILAWRRAQALLPPGTGQHADVAARIEELIAAAPRAPVRFERERLAPAGGLRSLLLAATQAGALLSLLAFFGVYWTAFGWRLAALLCASIYLHELGHAVEMMRRGFPASAPMFVPGFGAHVRMAFAPASAVENARIGLAGPAWGLGAAALAWALGLFAHAGVLLATARLGAWINLANLLPVWQLDGARSFSSLTRGQRASAALLTAAGFALTREPLLAALAVVSGARVVDRGAPRRADHAGLALHLALVAGLSALLLVRVAAP